MKITLRLVLLIAVIAAGVWLWTVLFPGPEKIILQRLAQVADSASFSPGENPLLTAARAERLGDFFSTNVEVRLDVPGHGQQVFSGRDEIVQTAAAVRSVIPGGLKVGLTDVTVAVAADQQSATADVTVKTQAAGEKDFNAQEVKFTLQKIAGDWLITRVETVRSLS